MVQRDEHRSVQELCCLCQRCNITSFIIENATFSALNGLQPLENCVGYDVLAATTDEATCNTSGGVLRPLWNSSKTNYTVCVLHATTGPSPSEPKSYVAVIVGASVCAVLVLMLSVWLFWRRGQHLYFDTLQDDLERLSEWKINPRQLHCIGSRPLASGAYGEVWLGTYNDTKVAIKRSHNKHEVAVRQFISEIQLMAAMRSPYIVQLIGASWRRPIDIECLVEYMNQGDLRAYLEKHTPYTYPWIEKALVIQGIVFGLVYLHTHGIIHRELKSRNVLLDRTKCAKFSDFGISRHTVQGKTAMTNNIGTFQWMAPETFTSTDCTVAADIYAIGVVLSELSTHAVPYQDQVNPDTGRSYTQHYIMKKSLRAPSYQHLTRRRHPGYAMSGPSVWR
ncbi:protein kinase [Achlya hypogyna]|uniref:Protein kinase n=1 Tax=Achlya hypogyna TaxID=1202772 RepID=A0A1V9YUF1_ACHHY|nr:protein kinase [Achlya hypogyna]